MVVISACSNSQCNPKGNMKTSFSRTHLYGWLLLLPETVLLIGFTHYPMAATLLDSFITNGGGVFSKGSLGVANYDFLMNDPVFKTVLFNNFWFALGTIPTSIGLALLMALMVNRSFTGRFFVRMAFFTPPILPMIAVANI